MEAHSSLCVETYLDANAGHARRTANQDDGKEWEISWKHTARKHRKHPIVSPDDLEGWDSLESYENPTQGTILVPGMDVELLGSVFLRVCQILVRPQSSDIFLRGQVFLRNGAPWEDSTKSLLRYNDEDLSDFLIEQPNEVHLLINIVDDAPFSATDQSLRLFPIAVFRTTRSIKITNQPYPTLNPGHADPRLCPTDTLICRWVAMKVWKSARHRDSNTISHCSRVVARIRRHEADAAYAVDDAVLMKQFRGITIKGGSTFGTHVVENRRRQFEAHRLKIANDLMRATGKNKPANFVDGNSKCPINLDDVAAMEQVHEYLFVHDDDADENQGTSNQDIFWERTQESSSLMLAENLQRYSLADIFGGCGGVAVAAVAAGFHVKYAVDHESAMCATYQLNNPATRIACADAREFVYNYSYDKKVDIMHLSFPCQPFSKAHTTAGKRDEQNREALGVLDEYLIKARPRIVTIEEADGLGTFKKHTHDLRRILLQLTLQGFSVELRIINLADYGICQERHRLVIVASCPGQRLPGFPRQTHSDPRKPSMVGVRPWMSVGAAIADIPSEWRHHDCAAEDLLIESNEYSSKDMCPTLITKNAQLVHFEGWRRFTIMEKLKIQGFPLYFEFPSGQKAAIMEKQIGNAVPPKAFEVILRHIRQEMLRDDL